ncbi:CbiX/SirB N-terminal domain-containing protein [Pseudofrankia sp. DC12]|uniref:sirohydrochlorin chelatase n=1 Tax=Pseudofrankia sp. DC12 TaxID=683315 RepID=UPI0005F76D6A|nr:CbiX/SirB N-terminal domain-containing protein [Pseudofrankia sp. DC12]
MRGLLVIGHGSRRDEANATVFALASALAAEPAALPAEPAALAAEPAALPAEPAALAAEPAALPAEPAALAAEPAALPAEPAAPDGQAAPPGGQPAWDVVEVAFLDVLRPDIADGYAALVDAGCTRIVAHPFFLFAGRHTAHDIPAALAAAQASHPHTSWTVTEPLGLHPGVVTAVRARVAERTGDGDPGPTGE